MSEHLSVTTATRRTPLQVFLLALGAALALLLALLLTNLSANTWVQVVILGIVQGLTEFLPISSTGHLLIASDLLNFQYGIGGTFEIFIQLGTVVAVVGFYIRELLTQARALPTSAEVRRFWLGVVLAFFPAALAGVLLHDWLKAVVYETPTVIAASLIVGGILFIVAERLPPRPDAVRNVYTMTWGQALGVGCAQVLALIPGVSRSGASIVGGMLAGLDRKTATTFSFYLAMPTLGAATIFDLLTSLDQLTPDDLGRLLVGTVGAGVVGWLSIGWLLRYVATNNFIPFAIYRIAAGLTILLLVVLGYL